uniref:Putative ovule protein n=1 Tax=Solanum chacoense TaxID=4108 RepID=A0A0V0HYP8_SOLCH
MPSSTSYYDIFLTENLQFWELFGVTIYCGTTTCFLDFLVALRRRALDFLYKTVTTSTLYLR